MGLRLTQQRRQPVDVGLGVGVEEDQDLGCGVPGSGDPRSDQTFPGWKGDQPDEPVQTGFHEVLVDGQLTRA